MRLKLYFLLIVLFFSNSVSVYALPPIKTTPKLEKGVVLKGSINQLLNLCCSAGIILDGEFLPSTVSKIRIGSPASYYGVSEKDKIENASIDKNVLKLDINRHGKKLQVSLPVSAQALREATSKLHDPKTELDKFMETMPEPVSVADPVAQAQAILEQAAKLSEKEKEQLSQFQNLCAQANKNLPPAKKLSIHKDIKALSDYDVILIVDCSSSMNSRLKDRSISKWQWAQEQMCSLSASLYSALKKGVTVLTFNDNYQIYYPCYAEDVLRVFNKTKPEGSTNLFLPLQDVLSRKMVSKRPMYICIFTDGGYGYKEGVKELIVSAANSIPGPYDLRIKFLVLDEMKSTSAIPPLSDLTTSGAKYDIVDITKIDELYNRGLQSVIIESISQP